MELVDFIVFTALKEEYLAVIQSFKILKTHIQNYEKPFRHTLIDLGNEISDHSPKPLRGIVAYSPDMGRLESAIACQEILYFFQPKIFFLVGLVGGFQKNNVHLGDILIATSIIDYERQRIDNEGSLIRWRTHNINNSLLDEMRIISSNWIDLIEEKHIRTRLPEIHFGPIFSGEKIIASTPKVEELLEFHPSAIGIEMEGTGVATLLERRNMIQNFCMIRGVSDLANENKRIDSAKWTEFACNVSAAFAVSMLFALAKKA